MSRFAQVWLVLTIALAVVVCAGMLVGAGDLSDPELRMTFVRLRAWRVINSFCAGAALAVGGVLVQGLFRNPLASPSIIGTSAGASLGGVVVLVLWTELLANLAPMSIPTELLMPLGCFAGATLALWVLLSVCGKDAGVVTLLLTGFVLSSLFLSLVGLFTSLAQDQFELGRAVVAFTLGGVEAKGPRHIGVAIPLVGIGSIMAWSWSRHLDALLSGEDEARSLGVDIVLVRRWAIIWTAVLTAAAVSVGGNISFVGLVVPHTLRPFIGVEHGRLLPASLVGGGAFVVFADVLTRVVPSGGPLPLGVVTSLIGAPLFLTLLARAAREGRIE